mmetsp:Transcript_134923/g.233875  ORF Transcript_134923/g.233875 Transcript_134923/m.233875 type:complete len:100 (-) Transcript_134923:138-437(-)
MIAQHPVIFFWSDAYRPKREEYDGCLLKMLPVDPVLQAESGRLDMPAQLFLKTANKEGVLVATCRRPHNPYHFLGHYLCPFLWSRFSIVLPPPPTSCNP